MSCEIRGYIQNFPDWPPGARNANGTALSQSSEFCRHNPLCCFSTSNTKGKIIFSYRLSPESFGYTLVSTALESTEKSVTFTRCVNRIHGLQFVFFSMCISGQGHCLSPAINQTFIGV